MGRLNLADRLIDPSNALRTTLEQLQVVSASRLEGLFVIDRPALWSPELREALESGEGPGAWIDSWSADEREFRRERQDILLY